MATPTQHDLWTAPSVILPGLTGILLMEAEAHRTLRDTFREHGEPFAEDAERAQRTVEVTRGALAALSVARPLDVGESPAPGQMAVVVSCSVCATPDERWSVPAGWDPEFGNYCVWRPEV